MNMQNAAYTPEYLEYRRKHDYLFSDTYKVEETERALPDGRHRIVTTDFTDKTHQVFQYNAEASRSVLFADDRRVAEFDCIGHHALLFSTMEHSNGRNYLLYTIDLYGYCVMDLETYKTWHYVPMASFLLEDETIIWTKALYCKKNNLIAVDGSYWAAPYGTCLYDCSNPEELPYPLLYDYYEMNDRLDFDGTPLEWKEDGTLVVEDPSNRKFEVDVSGLLG